MATIRKVEKKDKEQILEISSKIWEGNDFIPKVFDKWIEEKVGEFTAIEEEGKVVAFSKLNDFGNNVGWLEGLRVHEDYRGKGYAKLITEYYMEKAKKEGYEKLHLAIYKGEGRKHLIEDYDFHTILKLKYYDTVEKKNFETNKKIVLAKEEDSLYDYVINSKEYNEYKGFFNFDWSFKHINEKLINQLLKREEIFILKENNEIKGMIILSSYNNKENSLAVSFISGEDHYEDLLKFAFNKFSEKTDNKSILLMCPENLIFIKKKAKELGFKCFNQLNSDVWLLEHKVTKK